MSTAWTKIFVADNFFFKFLDNIKNPKKAESCYSKPDFTQKTRKMLQSLLSATFGPRREKTCLQGFANNTSADQTAHPSSLISAFVIHFLESIICKLAAGEISIF